MRSTLALCLLFLSLDLSAADLAAILRERVDVRKTTQAIAVAIVTPEGTTFAHYGSAGAGRAELSEDTLFRVASATKIFTGVLLAGIVEREEVALDDPVARYLPSGVVLPASRRPITLLDLATHRSGLPGMPADFRDDREYTADQLYRLPDPPVVRDHDREAGRATVRTRPGPSATPLRNRQGLLPRRRPRHRHRLHTLRGRRDHVLDLPRGRAGQRRREGEG